MDTHSREVAINVTVSGNSAPPVYKRSHPLSHTHAIHHLAHIHAILGLSLTHAFNHLYHMGMAKLNTYYPTPNHQQRTGRLCSPLYMFITGCLQ
jgi:hypothetical protein